MKIQTGTMKNQPGTMKNQPGTIKNHENRTGTMKNQPGTMNNYENRPGTVKNQPGTMKNHENRPGTMKNQPGRNQQKRHEQTDSKNLPIIYTGCPKKNFKIEFVNQSASADSQPVQDSGAPLPCRFVVPFALLHLLCSEWVTLRPHFLLERTGERRPWVLDRLWVCRGWLVDKLRDSAYADKLSSPIFWCLWVSECVKYR